MAYLPYLLVPLIFSIVGAVAFFAGLFYARQTLKDIEHVRTTPTCEADEVAYQAPQGAKMAGEMVAAGATLKAPLSQKKVVWFQLTVEEEVERVETERDAKGNTRRVTRREWVPVLCDTRMVAAGLRDDTGTVEVSLAEATVQLRLQEKAEPGMFSSPPRHIRDYMAREHDVTSGGWFDRKLRYFEKVIEPGDELFVIGKVKLVKTDKGVRPRFVKGERGLVLTDRTEREHGNYLNRMLWYSRLGMVAGPAVAVAACLATLIVFLGSGK